MSTRPRYRLRGTAVAMLPVLLVAGLVVQLPASASQPVVGTVTREALPATVAQHAGLVLNGDASQATRVAVGATYQATVMVRTSEPPVRGEVVTTETTATGSVSHSSEFTLSGTAWTAVTGQVVTELSGSRLSLSVVVFDGGRLEVQSSDLTPVGSPPSASTCAEAIPSGTAIGTSMSWKGVPWSQTLAGLDKAFGTLEAVRVWDDVLPERWSGERALATAGRTTVISFRPLPKDVLAGKYDKELRAFFAEAPANRTIYWSYVHEPEAMIPEVYTSAQYLAAWRYIRAIADDVCRPNMFATLILMGWTADPASKEDISDYYAGSDVIDVVAWDPYNGVHDPDRDYYPAATSMFAKPIARSAELGKPFAIAETGSRLVPGDAGSGRAAWLTEIGTYLREHDAVFVTYFQSTRDADWELRDTPSQQAWAKQIDLG